MFENLSGRLGDVLSRLKGRGALGEKDVDEAMREVRRALLEADATRKRRMQVIDNIAAAYILQGVLDRMGHMRAEHDR